LIIKFLSKNKYSKISHQLLKKKRKNLASGFESKKLAIFDHTRRLFEFDAAHRTKKTPKYGQIVDLFGPKWERPSFYKKTQQPIFSSSGKNRLFVF
jgi:hypothetical protein